MKKIIATVLAMVMALALCSTAFAADPVYTGRYTKNSDTKVEGTYTVSTDAATYNKDSGIGSVKVKKVTYGTTTEYYVESTKADYDVKLTADGRADLYLSEVDFHGAYQCKAVAFTAIGEKCGQYNGDVDSKYYTNSGKYSSKDDAVLFVESDAAGAFGILVNGEVVSVLQVVSGSVTALEDLVEQHDWKAASFDKDNKATSFKCAECGTVATVYKTVDAAKAAGVNTVETVTYAGETYVLGYNFTAAGTGSTTTTGAKPSPKTFDAGIALYAAMALTSVAGSAVVIGKKKEF